MAFFSENLKHLGALDTLTCSQCAYTPCIIHPPLWSLFCTSINTTFLTLNSFCLGCCIKHFCFQARPAANTRKWRLIVCNWSALFISAFLWNEDAETGNKRQLHHNFICCEIVNAACVCSGHGCYTLAMQAVFGKWALRQRAHSDCECEIKIKPAYSETGASHSLLMIPSLWRCPK